MKRAVLSICLLLSLLGADTQFADPKPTIENPRQFIFPITSGDEYQISHVLSSASNVMKFYGPEKCEIIIVCYSQGIKTVLAKAYFLIKIYKKEYVH